LAECWSGLNSASHIASSVHDEPDQRPAKGTGCGLSSLDGLADYARAFRRGIGIGRYLAVGRWLLHALQRQLIETIGGLDESFGSGNYEDDDFCLRATLAVAKM